MSPTVPVSRTLLFSLYVLPRASQLSSTSQRLCLSQKDFTAARSNGFPRVCAIMTALVFTLNASSSFVTSMLYCGMVTSTNTGTAPYWMTGVTVVGNPAATVMTSSPRRICRSPSSGAVNTEKAIRFADDPLFTRLAKRTSSHLANSRSNSSANRPVVSQKSSAASIRLHLTFHRILKER